MRFGRWAAAAAAMLLAGQAQAARYIEFQVTGAANYPYGLVGSNGVMGLTFTSIDTFAFDTASFPSTPNSPYPYGAGSAGVTANTDPYAYSSPYVIELQALSKSSIANISSDDEAGGPNIRFSFSFADVALGDTLKALPVTNAAYNYLVKFDPRHGGALPTQAGQITSVLARTSDVAPASLGATEQLFVTLLPEPATWAMLILGFGLAGASLRRRRASDQMAVA